LKEARFIFGDGVGGEEVASAFGVHLPFLTASMRDGSAFCMRDDAAAIERSVRLDRCN